MTPTTDITLDMTLHLSPRGVSIYEGIPYLIPVLTDEAGVATAHIGGATILPEIGNNRSDHLAVIIGPLCADNVRLAAVIKLRAYASKEDVYYEMDKVPELWKQGRRRWQWSMPPANYFDVLAAMRRGHCGINRYSGDPVLDPGCEAQMMLNARVLLGVHYIIERIAHINGGA